MAGEKTKVYVVWTPKVIWVTDEKGSPLARFINEAFGKGWLKTKEWLEKRNYEVVKRITPKLYDAPTKPGFYRRALFNWAPITREEYLREACSDKPQFPALLRIDPQNLAVVVWRKPWMELWTEAGPNGKFLYGTYVSHGERPSDKHLRRLEEWAEENGWSIQHGEQP